MITESRSIIYVKKCWGCNKLDIPSPWTKGTLKLLMREGRLRYKEYLCGDKACGQYQIVKL